MGEDFSVQYQPLLPAPKDTLATDERVNAPQKVKTGTWVEPIDRTSN